MKTKYPIYFISGIDTDIGKTVVTGLLAKYLLHKKVKVITQKPIESGTKNISSDIIKHREISRQSLTAFDKDGTTCSYLFSYPSSPHLAAELDDCKIDTAKILKDTHQLSVHFDCVLIEGAGGLYVPLTRQILTIDYIKTNNYPLILVTSDRLGSINHTLMSLELCRANKINIVGLIYNKSEKSDNFISNDTILVFKDYLKTNFPATAFIEVPFMKADPILINFEPIFL